MKKTGILICLIVAVLAIAANDMDSSATNMSSLTSDSIKEKEQQISQAQKEKESMKNSLSDLQKIKKELETQKKNLKNYVAQLDQNLEQIEQNVAELKVKIQNKEQEIAQSEAELEAALNREENQKESMINRIRLMYEQKDSYMTDMLLKSESFGDFLNKADYMERIVTYDKQQWNDFQENRHLVELCKEQLELEKQLLDQAKINVEIEQENLEKLIEQKHEDLLAYENDISNKANIIKEYEEEIKAQEEEIKALEQAIAEEKKKLLAESMLKYDGGKFKFPLASFTRVSSEYGDRIHPILNVPQFHNGVDFASPKGTAIYAAYDGKVVAATYSSTMGNYVMIDHGDGLYTIYMHASKLYVKKDAIVVRGETIAAVGSTGRSTANHLHFSVRLNGEYVSPWNYISK